MHVLPIKQSFAVLQPHTFVNESHVAPRAERSQSRSLLQPQVPDHLSHVDPAAFSAQSWLVRHCTHTPFAPQSGPSGLPAQSASEPHSLTHRVPFALGGQV
jgi:hypothetical protein